MSRIEITNSSECCGCEACCNVCPHNAISMVPDKRGFIYPQIDENKCIDCGLCLKVCDFIKPSHTLTECPNVFAAQNKKSEVLLNSASGGIFAALAEYYIANGGKAYGAAWDNDMKPLHKCAASIEGLKQLQGSKYVQSSIGNIYKEIKEELKKGTQVLFSGTPCQCAGLRSFLLKQYDNLTTVEIICHGVPSAQFLREYLNLIEAKEGGKVVDLKFRDKKRGWGALMNFTIQKNDGKISHKYLTTNESYYYYYYWGGNLYRPSCYNCKYAQRSRFSDFTIGDFWGVNLLALPLDEKKGVSVILANTSKAKEMIPKLEPYIDFHDSSLENAIKQNGQLSSPSKHKPENDFLWDIYEQDGAKGLADYYSSVHRKQIIIGILKRKMPLSLKRILTRFL